MEGKKKYFSITEAAQKTGLSNHKLRYIEKSNPMAGAVKIRGRRYYNKDTINYIISAYSKNNQQSLENLNGEMMTRIDVLILKLEQMNY